jgi:transcriptional regulator with XRE-family HTH domain
MLGVVTEGGRPDSLTFLWIGRSYHRTRFPNRIREYRLRAGITQLRLAQVVGRARSVVSAWERGHRLPSIPNLFALAKTLGTLGESLYVGLYFKAPTGSPEPPKE